jgi:glucose-1-phosphate thymidylyltransferase
MKLIVLAAGYATRLYPLTLDRPKPLLEVAGRAIIEHVLNNLLPVRGIERVYVVTNAKFVDHFRQWANGYAAAKAACDLTVVNDGTTDDSNKLGAIGDLDLVLRRERVEGDIIVVAGDNLFSHSLEGFGEYCRRRNAPVVAVYDVGDIEEVKKYNSIETDADGRITFFEEKPAHPKSSSAAVALYYYPEHSLPIVRRYVEEGNNPDQPGRLVEWMYRRAPFYTWRVPGVWYDIGTREALEEANRIFAAE